MTMRLVLKPVLAAAVLFAGLAGAEAMPVAPAAQAGTAVQAIQYRPGHNNRVQYRRALRRYRGHPGARFELRQNRRIFCRNTPERC